MPRLTSTKLILMQNIEDEIYKYCGAQNTAQYRKRTSSHESFIRTITIGLIDTNCGVSIEQIASALGISRRTVIVRLREYDKLFKDEDTVLLLNMVWKYLLTVPNISYNLKTVE